jgi:hypothetical protein
MNKYINNFVEEANNRKIKFVCVDNGEEFKNSPFIVNADNNQFLIEHNKYIWKIYYNNVTNVFDFAIKKLSKIDKDNNYLCNIDCYTYYRLLEVYVNQKKNNKNIPNPLIFALGSGKTLKNLLTPCTMCIDPTNPHAVFINTLHTSSKSQWLIKVGSDLYHGLSSSGPISISQEDWAKRLDYSLKLYIVSELNNQTEIFKKSLDNEFTILNKNKTINNNINNIAPIGNLLLLYKDMKNYGFSWKIIMA